MERDFARNVVRCLVAAALGVALLGSALAPTPEKLPSVSLGQVGIYRLEIALLVFYGGLLLITPAFSGLARGRLPIEVSTRGAKFAEEADRPEVLAEAKLEELENTTRVLTEGLTNANVELEELRSAAMGDIRQPGVGWQQ
jgi:hypothetical protein